MGKIKAAFFDIDWTLYDHGCHAFTPSALEAIKELKEKGIKVFLCTARPYQSLVDLGTNDLGIKWDGFVSSNGGVAYADGIFLRKTLMKQKTLVKFSSLCKSLKLTFEFVSPFEREMAFSPNAYVQKLFSVYSETTPKVRRYHGQDVIGLLLFAPKCYDSIIKSHFPKLIYHRFSDYGVDVMEESHEKGDGVPLLLNHFGIKKEEAIGFGDDIQDISMANSVGQFVAMGQGKEELKAVASFVTARIEDDGVLKGLRHYGLLS